MGIISTSAKPSCFPRDDALLATTGRLLGGSVAVALRDPTRDYPLYPEERAAVRGAVAKRLREFSASRAAARAALRQLGAAAAAIPMGADRAPVWPAGIRGSITHAAGVCLAAVAWERQIRWLGLDAEATDPLERDLIPLICTQQEQAWLARQPQSGLCAKLIFSAKECAYKAQYPESLQLFGFDTLRIDLDLAEKRFTAVFVQSVPGFTRGTQLQGRFAITHSIVVTGIAVPRAS